MQYPPSKIRNIAIIAHIDHGKTTLLDQILQQADTFHSHETVPERVMDSYEQERERGITIFAKHTSICFDGNKINIIDTPGHADFSGEVERILGMVNSVLLLVDAQEGPKPQTRFVLRCALGIGLQPIVVINKIDKPHADPDAVLNKTFDLFVELGANDEQLDFPYIYASGIEGFAVADLNDPKVDMRPLFEMIVEKTPPPPGDVSLPFLMQAATLSYDDFIGRQATGRILEGTIKMNDPFVFINREGEHTKTRVRQIQGYTGIKKIELEQASAGDIVSIAGAQEIMIGDTLCDPNHIQQLPPIELGEPTLSIEISVNDGPFVGKDGKHVTMNKIRDRLLKEKRANPSLKVEEIEGREEAIRLCGRGELHLSILFEAMRRESYEFVISQPQVIRKNSEEPYENCHIEVPDAHAGAVIEEMARRKGEMQNLFTDAQGITHLQFIIPTRGLIGYRNEFLTMTRGEGILTSIFDSFGPWKGAIQTRKRGALISLSEGKATAYAAFTLQDRGFLYVKAGDMVYEGMIVGQHRRENDLTVNITKEKHLTNIRAAGSDEHLTLTPHKQLTLEQAMDAIASDELVEITPNYIRLRKKYLTEVERKRRK